MVVSWMAASELRSFQNSLRRCLDTGSLGNSYFLTTGCLSIQFFDSPPFSQHSQLGRLWLPTPWMPCHAIHHQVLPTPAFNVTPHPSVIYRQVLRPILYFQASSSQSNLRIRSNPYLEKLLTQSLPREAEDLSRAERCFKHVSRLTYLIYLSPKEVYWQVLFKGES